MNLFSRKKPEVVLRENQRILNRTIRELDRERIKMEQQERKVISDLKQMANKNQMDAVKVIALDLVRTRRQIKKLIMMKINIQGVASKLVSLKSNASMGNVMCSVAKTLSAMNRQINLPQIQKIAMEFERQSEMMEMKQEAMDDAIDDVVGDADDDIETDKVVEQVLDELGIKMTADLNGICYLVNF
ncbi:charged multivesicular body protein 2a-like [Octopus sinensis]|uniref:Charged multivesicular body protein 2a-like n=1 Tax=Octopus sinensis TaxID=2607531 RepID=A0A6P7TYZ9_9MOLL|nr:charged multivesicular body protein 2a-like [Octopus sinensis]